jgi:hypothetical protein
MNRTLNLGTPASIALISGLIAAAWAPQAFAKQTRDSAMATCIQRAEKQYPRNDGTQRQQRTALYKDCMVSAGHHP